LRIVLDTTVLVSGLLSPFGPPGEIVRLVSSGVVTLCLDARILSEYDEVLARPRFGFGHDSVAALLDYLSVASETAAAEPLPVRHGRSSTLVVVDDLNVVRVAVDPGEADTPLIVDADTVLSFAIPRELLQTVRGWAPEVVDRLGVVEHSQLAQRYPLDVFGQLPGEPPAEDPLGLVVGERLDHGSRI
jgi:predicted nucleic acid-binding protein